jgi:hypothetical protein
MVARRELDHVTSDRAVAEEHDDGFVRPLRSGEATEEKEGEGKGSWECAPHRPETSAPCSRSPQMTPPEAGTSFSLGLR